MGESMFRVIAKISGLHFLKKLSEQFHVQKYIKKRDHALTANFTYSILPRVGHVSNLFGFWLV